MRIPNLIIQGLIAGAILFIPEEVFAEKRNAEKRNSAAEYNNQTTLKQENASPNVPEQAGRKENESKPVVSEAKQKNKEGKTPVLKGSERSAEVRTPNSAVKKANSSQNTKNSNGIKKSVPLGQIKKINISNQTEPPKRVETSKLIHTEAPINKSELSEHRVVNENKGKFSKIKVKGVDRQKEAVQKPFREFPSNEVPETPASKAIPVTAGHTSSHSSASKDTGATALANFKASLVLPLIFADSEKVSVYFSRMDLLRSQWVNAPPAPPPETAL